MFKLNEEHYLRNCYFNREQVPTQSMMISKMQPPLANVYFKSMTPKLKELAGLEPPLKGGGNDWFVPPKELLAGKAVLKPTKKKYLSLLGFYGIDTIGEVLIEEYRKKMEEEKNKAIIENDLKWKKNIERNCNQFWDYASRQAKHMNTKKIKEAFDQFQSLYSTSINKVEALLFQAVIKDIKRYRDETYMDMKQHYKNILKIQATRLYDKYIETLERDKLQLKETLVNNLEEMHTNMVHKVEDINVEKHTAIEKLRHLLQCQNLACQVYIALKERKECKRQIDQSKQEHQKKVKELTEELAIKEFEIKLVYEKEKKREEFNKIWQKKVCHVVKKFQVFVSYCLKSLPKYAEFFTNIEKLLLLQLSETMEEPSLESLFEPEEKFHTPIARPHPMFLCCDKGYKPKINQNLCPKHCTSSASQLPVIVVNKTCLYAACDNFSCFTDKIEDYIKGQRGDDTDFYDGRNYEFAVPMKSTSEQQLLELKLESSLMQILQQELPNVMKVSTKCCICDVPHCFCSRLEATEIPSKTKIEPKEEVIVKLISSGNKIDTRPAELKHQRQPKWNSYINYIAPKCTCAAKAKTSLKEHLPPYMRNLSEYVPTELPTYVPCSLIRLKLLVEKAKGKQPEVCKPVKVESKTKDIGTQYLDQEYENICTCFSDDELEQFYKELMKNESIDVVHNKFQVVDAAVSPFNLNTRANSFATHRAFSLRNVLDDSSEMIDIFAKKECNFD